MSPLSPYRAVLRTPHARGAFVSSLAGRLCYGIVGLSLLIRLTAGGRDYGFAGGPRFKYRQFFVHSLFGADRLTGTEPIAISGASVSFSQTDFMFIQGGGVQLKIAPHVAVRTSADWVLTRHNISGGNRVDQNNFRVGVGLVFTFGGGR